jgi:hypothetical protein
MDSRSAQAILRAHIGQRRKSEERDEATLRGAASNSPQEFADFFEFETDATHRVGGARRMKTRVAETQDR